MSKRRRQRRSSRVDPVLVLMMGFLVGYLGAEFLMARFVHPLHWLTAAATAVLGYTGVLLWYRWQRAGRSG